MKRIKLIVGSIAAVAVVAVGIVGTGTATATKEVAPAKIVVSDAKTTHHLNLYVAQELGLTGADLPQHSLSAASAIRNASTSG